MQNSVPRTTRTQDEPRDFDADLAEIRRLLTEAYRHYFDSSDGHCKSSEGAISVFYPSFFWRKDDPEVIDGPRVSIYSYVLGPGRNHEFDSTAKALAAVREWHAAEMAQNYYDDGPA